ncbi:MULTISPECIES: Bug family tripartite tricarboxylate transporter substrate binding protein [Ramlibacter]|uniref:Tripartite tricarboxylate transporter substrate binding protein n=1 Tax=Ramlibacter pinisoli TaxID=2682844 RepID=A0A6N8J0C1_9BURK|nr:MULTISPECIES: tripartite tricarboxylate transporter substrate binding protein [Ramlibacter]MBA2961768.1 tripartite tricarboxylate transporter substrate binding protein [Ramlibacter sp. CGMCC 1.13660]MVQ31710.1 tripartite tricarboxylate transporter substrate binding protein [Ramlibacter pinisoli]
MKKPCATLAIAMLAWFSLFTGDAQAQFPDRPIRIVVPYAPGGSTDIAARLVADALGKSLNTSVIVQNQPGASGNIGAAAVARATPDGYTLLFVGSGIASAPSMKEVPFDLRKDLAPISRVVSSQFSILVNPSLNIHTLQEFLDYARANPSSLNMACSGTLTAAHFALESFRQAAKLDFQTIQFNGNAPAALAMMSGQPPAGIDAAFSAKNAVTAGKLRALAVTGSKRSPSLPGVPTVAEAGIPGFEAGFSLVMFAPGATPKALVDRIHQALVAALKDPAVVQKLEAQGFDLIGSSPADFARELEADIKANEAFITGLRRAGVIQ